MSTFQEINLNVKKINKLIERYERNNKASKVPNVLTDFKKRIKALADNLASDISDSEELKSRLKESKEILNGVKLATNTPETKRLPPKKARVVAIQETPDVISLPAYAVD
jgi:Zn-dependent M32 family carboxypeptidase